MDAPRPKRTNAKHPGPPAGTFGVEFRAARRAAGKTQIDIVLALGLSKAYLSAVETGRDSRGAWVPSHEKCVQLAQAVGAGPDEVRRLCGLAAAQRPAGAGTGWPDWKPRSRPCGPNWPRGTRKSSTCGDESPASRGALDGRCGAEPRALFHTLGLPAYDGR